MREQEYTRGPPGPELPPPEPAALAHSRQLAERIRARIEAGGGAIGFAEFMDLALYAPGLGYYRAGARKFGPAGDFVTAPELSPLFGQTLADFCAPALRQLGGGDILELGAGTGALAADLLCGWPADVPLPRRYLILELSGELRARQRETLARRAPALLERVVWLDAWPQPPLSGVILANEVLDALPVRRFVREAGTTLELAVEQRADGFGWVRRPADASLHEAVAELEAALGGPLPAGYVSEYCPSLAGFLGGLADSLAAGMLLLLDYGCSRREYYHPQRSAGRLICHYRHRAHEDPFLYPGLQDLSAWVDFSAVVAAARRHGLAVAGYCTQAALLLAAGFEQRFTAAIAAGGRDALAAAQQARQLLLPGEMGETVKAIVLTRGDALFPAGVGGRDLRHLL